MNYTIQKRLYTELVKMTHNEPKGIEMSHNNP